MPIMDAAGVLRAGMFEYNPIAESDSSLEVKSGRGHYANVVAHGKDVNSSEPFKVHNANRHYARYTADALGVMNPSTESIRVTRRKR